MATLVGIKETCLTVSDIERSELFYRQLFDLPLLDGDAGFRALNVANAQVLLLFARGRSSESLSLPGGTIPPHEARGQSHVGFAISASDLAEWEVRLKKHGVAIESTVTWPRGGASLYFRDPDDHLIELMTPGVWSIY
jgi:catechol 2,3-dioxygenase-like lactoylglutathione lyase family enzyme